MKQGRKSDGFRFPTGQLYRSNPFYELVPKYSSDSLAGIIPYLWPNYSTLSCYVLSSNPELDPKPTLTIFFCQKSLVFAIKRCKNVPNSLATSACLSLRMYRLEIRRKDFHNILYFGSLINNCRCIPILIQIWQQWALYIQTYMRLCAQKRLTEETARGESSAWEFAASRATAWGILRDDVINKQTRRQ
jgi:hypothetical protein